MADAVDGARAGLVLATSTGGVGRHVRAVAAEATRRGADVVVAGPAATEASFDFVGAGAAFRPVEIRDGAHPVADLRAGIALRAALADREVVHAHGLRAGVLAVRAAPPRAPVVVTWHNTVLARGPLRRAYALLERVAAARADVTLCVSSDLVERVRALGGRDVRLAPVGSSPPVRSGVPRAAVRRSLDVPAGTSLVLAVGRLNAQKGFDVLVDASARLRHQPLPRVAIAGDGPARSDLEQRIRDRAAPVRLLGWRSDLGDLLAAADLVVMPSRWEGSPLSAHEALLAGRPLVATRVGGLPELLDGAAVLVPPEDATALATAIDDLLGDEDRREAIARAGKERAAAWPDSATAAARAVDVHAELLGRR